MKFFKPEDFNDLHKFAAERVCWLANDKLERAGVWFNEKTKDKLVLKIDPEPCTHPKEKVRYVGFWVCECGKYVEPTSFETKSEEIK